MRRLVHDFAARADLVEIWTYSFERWGEEPADRYLQVLDSGLRVLAAYPRSGRPRESLRPDYWSKRVEQHVVFYTFTPAEVRVRRVLHGLMDPESRL